MTDVIKSNQISRGRFSDGVVGVMPTDTVYGLVARAADVKAIERLYMLKNRNSGAKPGTLLAASIDQLVKLGFKRRYLVAVEHYWPGRISVVVPTGPVLSYLHLGRYSLAVRIPDKSKLVELLNATGPLLTTSANQPGGRPAQSIDEARQYFGSKVDFYVDGGKMLGQASTVIRIVDDAVEVLRRGSVNIDEETGRIIENDI